MQLIGLFDWGFSHLYRTLIWKLKKQKLCLGNLRCLCFIIMCAHDYKPDTTIGQTFPAPTGPITARSCSGFTLKDTFCKVGASSICKKKPIRCHIITVQWVCWCCCQVCPRGFTIWTATPLLRPLGAGWLRIVSCDPCIDTKERYVTNSNSHLIPVAY